MIQRFHLQKAIFRQTSSPVLLHLRFAQKISLSLLLVIKDIVESSSDVQEKHNYLVFVSVIKDGKAKFLILHEEEKRKMRVTRI